MKQLLMTPAVLSAIPEISVQRAKLTALKTSYCKTFSNIQAILASPIVFFIVFLGSFQGLQHPPTQAHSSNLDTVCCLHVTSSTYVSEAYYKTLEENASFLCFCYMWMQG